MDWIVQYDDHKRVVSIDGPEPGAIDRTEMNWAADGSSVGVTFPTHTASYFFDSLGRITQKSSSDGQSLHVVYQEDDPGKIWPIDQFKSVRLQDTSTGESKSWKFDYSPGGWPASVLISSEVEGNKVIKSSGSQGEFTKAWEDAYLIALDNFSDIAESRIISPPEDINSGHIIGLFDATSSTGFGPSFRSCTSVTIGAIVEDGEIIVLARRECSESGGGSGYSSLYNRFGSGAPSQFQTQFAGPGNIDIDWEQISCEIAAPALKFEKIKLEIYKYLIEAGVEGHDADSGTFLIALAYDWTGGFGHGKDLGVYVRGDYLDYGFFDATSAQFGYDVDAGASVLYTSASNINGRSHVGEGGISFLDVFWGPPSELDLPHDHDDDWAIGFGTSVAPNHPAFMGGINIYVHTETKARSCGEL